MSQTFIVPEDVVIADPGPELPLDEMEAVRRYGRLLQSSTDATRALGELEGRFAGETIGRPERRWMWIPAMRRLPDRQRFFHTNLTDTLSGKP